MPDTGNAKDCHPQIFIFLPFYKNESKVDSHIVKLTVDMFQISYISLIELKIERSALYLHTRHVSCATNIKLEKLKTIFAISDSVLDVIYK